MSRRLPSIILLGLLIVALSATGRQARAQQPVPQALPSAASDGPPPSYDTPPAITLVDGKARLLRQGQSQAAVVNMPLVEGDRVATDDGRVAITFPDGSRLHVDRNTTVDFLSMSLMRLRDGRVILVAAGRGGERMSVDYQVDAPAASVRVQSAGQYRISAHSGEVELDVVSGVAALASDQGSVQVEAGERSFASEGQAPSDAQAFNSARLDEFDQWSESQRDAEVGTTSAQYLPADLQVYSSTFDQNGRWQNDASYGNVWYPTVSVGWRPYYNGYWDNVGPYGWTWIGYDPWCWPTQHFGRWGFQAGLWFWIPGVHWGPAWVSWGYSPGYYGWCPLDYYNHAVIGFGHHGGFYDPWRCWTVVPHSHFGPGYRVAHYAVPGAHLAAAERSAFAIGRTGPRAGVAVARQGSAASGRAMARALPSVSMQARPRDSMFAAGTAVPRGTWPGSSQGRASQRAGVSSTAPRYDARSLPYAAAAPRASSAYPGSATPRGSVRQATPYDNRTAPSYRAMPRGSDRPPSAQSPQPRGDTYSTPRYSAPPARGQSYSSPRYSAPPPSRYPAPSYRPYSAPSSPRYSAPASPRYSPPSYSAPAPRYSAPSYSAPAPRYSAPSYSAPRSASPGYAAPRSGGGSAPRSAPSGSSRPAPSGGRPGGGRGR